MCCGLLLVLIRVAVMWNVPPRLVLFRRGRDELLEVRGGLLRARDREHVLLRWWWGRPSSRVHGNLAGHFLHGVRGGLLRVGGGALGVLAVRVGDLCDRVRRDLMR